MDCVFLLDLWRESLCASAHIHYLLWPPTDLCLLQIFGFILWIVFWTDLFHTFHEMQQGIGPKPPIFFVTPLVVGMTMVSMETQTASELAKLPPEEKACSEWDMVC